MKQEAAALCLLFNVSTAKNGTMIDLARKTVQQSIHIEQTKTKLSQQNITKLLVKMSRPFQTITETCPLARFSMSASSLMQTSIFCQGSGWAKRPNRRFSTTEFDIWSRSFPCWQQQSWTTTKRNASPSKCKCLQNNKLETTVVSNSPLSLLSFFPGQRPDTVLRRICKYENIHCESMWSFHWLMPHFTRWKWPDHRTVRNAQLEAKRGRSDCRGSLMPFESLHVKTYQQE